MWRGILTGVVTLGAVVTEVSEVAEIGGSKIQPAFHRREDRAIPFAIAASVADGQDASAFSRWISLWFR
jgi:hypothetical protein